MSVWLDRRKWSAIRISIGYSGDQIEIVNATEVIETAEPPVNAIRRKKDSSIVVGMKMVKEGKADAFVSAGSSGAVLVGGQVIVGRLKGVERPPLAPLFPHGKGSKPSGGLRSQCGRQALSSCPVCQDGFHLYGTRDGDRPIPRWASSTSVRRKRKETRW